MNLINGELPESGLREQFAKLSCVTAPLVRIQYSPPFLGYVGGPGGQCNQEVGTYTTRRRSMNTNPIYTITTLRGTIHDGIRTVGFAHDLEDAIEWVEENAMDINECDYYWYVCIEKVNPGKIAAICCIESSL